MFRPPYHVELKDVPFPLTEAELAKQIARYDKESGDWAKRREDLIPDQWYTDKSSYSYAAYGFVANLWIKHFNFNPEFLKWLDRNMMAPALVGTIFVSPPGYSLRPHIDYVDYNINYYWRLNFPVNLDKNADKSMAFWDPRDCNMERRNKIRHPKMPYTEINLIEFDDETRPKVKKHFDTQMGKCSLICVGGPDCAHSMIYDGEKESYTISIDFRDKRTGSRIHDWKAIEKRMGHLFVKDDKPSPISAWVKEDGEFGWSRDIT
jgi:hypothetical protein